MKIYLVKIGDNTFEYYWLTNKLSLHELKKSLDKRLSISRQILGNNDIEMLKNSGGTVLYKKGSTYWLVNIEHKQDKKIGVILGKELTSMIFDIITRIKRDKKLKSII